MKRGGENERQGLTHLPFLVSDGGKVWGVYLRNWNLFKFFTE